MVQPAKQIDQKTVTENLRGLRQADEAARKAAGTWGDLSVGELTHQPSRSVYVQIWKGAKRPDIGALTARSPAVPLADWPAVEAWLKRVGNGELHKSIVAWTVSKAEAARLKEKRMEENRVAGLTVVNPTAA